MLHHGRFQAQGRGLEVSVKWEQDVPLTVEDGHALLDRLEERLPRRERVLRADSFAQMHAWIDSVGATGGLDAFNGKHKFDLEGGRVDVEILKGKAFVP